MSTVVGRNDFTFDEVASVLNLKDSVALRRLLKDSEIKAFAPVPRWFDEPPAAGGEIISDADIFFDCSALRTADVYEEKLAEYCWLQPPLEWKDNRIECRTIVITTDNDKAPTLVKGIDTPGITFGTDGAITHNSWRKFRFDEIDIRFDRVEVHRYRKSNTLRKKRESTFVKA